MRRAQQGATVHTWARHARFALAGATSGTLHVDGLDSGVRTAADVVLYDEDGRPRLLCDPDSAIVSAARRGTPAVLGVPCCPRSRCPRSVVFGGRLVLLGAEDVDGMAVPIVGVQLDSVTLAHAGRPALRIPVAAYLFAGRRGDPDSHPDSDIDRGIDSELDEVAESIVAHTNAEHGRQLRDTIAALVDMADGDIAAAQLEAVDPAGLDLSWVDLAGAHRVRLPFATPADSAQSLAHAVRGALTVER